MTPTRPIPTIQPCDVLALAAHRDDNEITCGGLLIQCVDRGHRVACAELTAGERGSSGDAETRRIESEAASKIMGLVDRVNFGWPDAAVEVTQSNKLAIATLIRQARPHLLILMNPVQRHPDHAAASQLGWDAAFLAGLLRIDLDGLPPHRPAKVLYPCFNSSNATSFIVDIGEQFERKRLAVHAYDTQVGPESHIMKARRGTNTITEIIELQARWWGSQIGVRYGEGYMQKESVQIMDVMTLPVKSI